MASKKPVIHANDHLPGGADPIDFPTSTIDVVGLVAGQMSVDLATAQPGLLWRYELGEAPTLPTPGTNVNGAFLDTSGNGNHLNLRSYAASLVANAPTFDYAHTELGAADDGAVKFNYQQTTVSIGDKPGWWLANGGPTGSNFFLTAGNVRTVFVQFKPLSGYTGANFSGLICGTWNMDGTGSFNVGWGLFYNAVTGIVSFSSTSGSGVGTASVSMTAPGALTAGRWYSLAVTFDGTSAWTLWIDGVPVATATQASNTGATSSASDKFNIGRGRADSGVSDLDIFVYGAVDRCLGYSTPLTAAQLAALTTATGTSTSTTYESGGAGIGSTADVGSTFGVHSAANPSGYVLESDGAGGSKWVNVSALTSVTVYKNGA